MPTLIVTCPAGALGLAMPTSSIAQRSASPICRFPVAPVFGSTIENSSPP
jgi:hypothetical protein